MSELDDAILSHLCEVITNSFQEEFLVEVTDGIPEGLGIPAEFRYGLDSTEEGSIALNLLPMIVASKTDPEGGVVAMAAKFHLLRTCEKQLNGNLEGIDALLGKISCFFQGMSPEPTNVGCPVLMFQEKLLEGDAFDDLSESHRSDVCLTIFYCINWFRELVCRVKCNKTHREAFRGPCGTSC